MKKIIPFVALMALLISVSAQQTTWLVGWSYDQQPTTISVWVKLNQSKDFTYSFLKKGETIPTDYGQVAMTGDSASFTGIHLTANTIYDIYMYFDGGEQAVIGDVSTLDAATGVTTITDVPTTITLMGTVLYVNASAEHMNKPVMVYNILGQPVRTATAENAVQSIDMQGLPKGAYIASVGAGSDRITKKIELN